MVSERRILTVIPARGGSKGVPRKNVQVLNGKPLIAYVIAAARACTRTDKLLVSTDDAEIAAIARELGAETPFLRPAELATDEVILVHVMQHALKFFDEIGESFDAVLSLQATVPLIRTSTITRVIEKFHGRGSQAVGTVSAIRHGHPYIAKRLTGRYGDEAVDFLELPPNVARYPRQERPSLYYFNGAVFLRDRRLLDEMDLSTNCLGPKPGVIVMPDQESINIDDSVDLRIAEALLRDHEAAAT